MQIKVMPLCLGMGIGMIVMKMICMKSCTSEPECLKEECNTCSKEQGKEKVMTKAKEKISQIVSDIEKLEILTEYIEDKYHYKTATILNFIKLEE